METKTQANTDTQYQSQFNTIKLMNPHPLQFLSPHALTVSIQPFPPSKQTTELFTNLKALSLVAVQTIGKVRRVVAGSWNLIGFGAEAVDTQGVVLAGRPHCTDFLESILR
jgi:hypothetical protein